MTVKDIQESANYVLVGAGSLHEVVTVISILKPGHGHGWVVSDKLEKRRTEPHEHVVHLKQRENLGV